MADGTTTVQDALPKEGQPSDDKGKTPSQAKTFTQEEVDKLVAERHGKLDKQVAELTKENATLKSQAEEATAAVTAREERIAELEQDIETASEGNPDAASVLKLKKELREEKAKLTAEVKAEKDANAELKKTLERDREQFAGELSEARALRFEVDVFEIAEDFDGGDADKLKALCQKSGKTKRDEIEELASVLWSKKAQENKTEEPEVTPDSGVTKGGTNPTKAQIRDAFIADPGNMDKKRAYEVSLRT